MNEPTRDPLLRVRLSAGYGSQTILHKVAFDLQPGRALGFVGSSGAGKSTLVLALMDLLRFRGGWSQGEVQLEGTNLLGLRERDARRLRGNRIALVPQSPSSALNHAISLRAHFEEAWRAHSPTGSNGLDSRLPELLTEVQLPSSAEFLKRRPGSISVGQAQRIMIALALLHRPAVLIADEPTSALDPVTQAGVLALLKKIVTSTGTTLLYISHDLISVLQLCDELAVLDQGHVTDLVAVAHISRATHSPALARFLATLPVPLHVLLSHRDELAHQATGPDDTNA